MKPKRKRVGNKLAAKKVPSALARDIGLLIEEARAQVARAANAALTTLYWQIGTRIRQEVLGDKRAEYGAAVVSALGRQLQAEFGRGFSEQSLRHMLRFAETFPDPEILSALRRELSWSHFKQLIYLDDPLAREFYGEMSRIERWSTRTLQKKIDGMLYERTALSKKPAALIKKELAALRDEDRVTTDLVFQDPYLLDFLGLRDTYSEKDLESALLREIERFLLELGAGFAFVERQKRITLDGDDYYIDLLFFHRRMRRLVVIELKIGDFKPADSGQVELYLRWLDRHERQPGEEAPIRDHPLRGQEAGDRRVPRPRQERHPRGRVPDRAPAARGHDPALPPSDRGRSSPARGEPRAAPERGRRRRRVSERPSPREEIVEWRYEPRTCSARSTRRSTPSLHPPRARETC